MGGKWGELVGKIGKSDIFSLGATLIALALRVEDKENVTRVQRGEEIFGGYSGAFSDLLRKMVEHDVDKRPSIEALQEELLLASPVQKKYLRAKRKAEEMEEKIHRTEILLAEALQREQMLKQQVQYQSQLVSSIQQQQCNKLDLILNHLNNKSESLK